MEVIFDETTECSFDLKQFFFCSDSGQVSTPLQINAVEEADKKGNI